MSVYTRLSHFQNSIEFLKKSSLARLSHLVVYSDAAAKVSDEKTVSSIREYANNITGFKSVTVIQRAYNYGGVKNAHEAVKQLVKIFNKAIFLEDDIQVAPGFLAFMNDALSFYENNHSVISISGYSPPLDIQQHIDKDFFTMNRFCGWGCGLFERTIPYLTEKINPQDFENLSNKEVLKEFGDDVLAMVKREVKGELDAADVRCMYKQALNNKATIYPRYSLVQNNGHDGTGYHCGKTNRFLHERLWDKTDNFLFDNELNCSDIIKREQQDFRAFDGKYKHLKTIYNLTECKEISMGFIQHFFENKFDYLTNLKNSENVNRKKIAVISTPRVGSTWLCSMLSQYIGKSIEVEWLHKRFYELYKKNNNNSSAIDYLTMLKQTVFEETPSLGLHFHVNQYKYWLTEHNIDILKFFEFDHIIYMQREDLFEQSYSFAVAAKSGLWGNEIIQSLNFSDSFVVNIDEESVKKAIQEIEKETAYYQEHIKHSNHINLVYEDLKKDPVIVLKSLCEESLGLEFIPLENYSSPPEKIPLIYSQSEKFELKKLVS